MKRFGFGFLSDRKRKNVCCLSLRKARSKVLCLVVCGQVMSRMEVAEDYRFMKSIFRRKSLCDKESGGLGRQNVMLRRFMVVRRREDIAGLGSRLDGWLSIEIVGFLFA